jgi:pyruvate/2-oxoglutarate/acetoin dehydrogenase E1 component
VIFSGFKVSVVKEKMSVTASNHVNQSTDKDFTIKVVDAKKIVPLMITTPDVSVPEKTEKVITLKSNKGKGTNIR